MCEPRVGTGTPLGLHSPVPNRKKKGPVDRPRRRQRDQWGNATLELIVLFPLLVLMFFGIVEMSRAWHNLNILTTAAREGARVGSVTPADGNDVFDPSAAETRIDGILAAANLGVTDNGDGTYTLTGATRTVTCATPCVPDSEVKADVEVTFQTAVPLVLPMLQSLTIQQSATMRYE